MWSGSPPPSNPTDRYLTTPMTTRKKAVALTTPRGTAVWPRLNSPDYKYDKAGKYSCKLRLKASDPAVQALKAQLEKMRDDFLAEEIERLKGEKKAALAMELKAGEVLKIERNSETGEETGYLLLNASMKASGVREKDGTTWTQKPSIFDAKGKALNNPPIINGGSEVKLSLDVDPFIMPTNKEAIVGIRLKAVQILKLVSGGARSFSDLGFSEEEGDEIEDGSTPFANEEPESAASSAHADL